MFTRVCNVCGDRKQVKSRLLALARYCNKCTYSSPERFEKLSKAKGGSAHHFYGKHLAEEHKQKIGAGNKGKTVRQESRKKISATRIGMKLTGTRLGVHLSEETKRRIRIGGHLAYLRKHGGYPTPYHNPNACKLFEKLEAHFGWNGQYASKDGEYHITDLGYWVDYYEPNLNLVIEYDERLHSRRKDKDAIRQQNICEKLACTFIRISEFDAWEEIVNRVHEYLHK